MTTVGDLINDVRSRLSGTFTDELNVLGVDYTPGSGTVTLTYDTLLTPGSVMSCGENSWYVVAADAGTAKTVQVIPSYDGGPDLAKTTGAIVRMKPRVTDWSIFGHLRDQCMAMCSPVNGLGRFDFWMDYGLKTNQMYSPPLGVTPSKVHKVYGSDGTRWWPVFDFRYELGSVRIGNDRWLQYCFVYVEPFVELTSFTQDIDVDIHLSKAMHDIPVLGAAGMLLLTMENRRQQLGSQGDPRRSAEIQPGSNMGAGREMLRMRDQRIAQEYGRQLNLTSMTESGGM